MDTMLTYNTNSKTGPVCGAGKNKNIVIVSPITIPLRLE